MPNASGRRRRVSCCPAELPKGNEAVSPRIEDPSRRTFLAATGTAIAAGSAAGQDDPPLAPPDKQPPNLSVPDASPKTVGWAVAGPGQLALEEVLPAFGDCKLSKPVALVSGHPGKAAKVARRYGVDPKKVYDYQNYDQNYDRISEDPAVEAVYVILPNSMHAEFTIRAHKAGKHVLCEKPMAGSPAEAERMISAAKAARRKLMIAYRLRYEPFNEAAIDIRRKKELGVLKSITASNCQNVKPPNIRLSEKLAGGPVEDVGVYCVNAARYLTGEEPVEVSAVAHRPTDDPRFREVHQSVAFMLRFPSGVIANCRDGRRSALRRPRRRRRARHGKPLRLLRAETLAEQGRRKKRSQAAAGQPFRLGDGAFFGVHSLRPRTKNSRRRRIGRHAAHRGDR
jgi:predicted dehydrogenase